ncbi:spermine synthase [Magallana gigas]|uniref:spermine synthase n=1 Tax=Magallana gigas TaxID=29159 RepID=UPI003340D136
MGTATVVMSFALDQETFNSKEAHELYQSLPNVCFEGSSKHQTISDCGERGDKLITATSDDGSHVVIHLYHFAYLTMDITFVVDNVDQLKPLSEPFSFEYISALEQKAANHLEKLVKVSNSLKCPIRRGPSVLWAYGHTGDERLFEADYEDIVFETDSKWQNIKIAKSREFGNVLLLDDDIMLGESDLVYTETLLGLERNAFKDKTILILGGGDGGILHELLKMSPAYVLMAEIDEEVIKACSKHMKKVCGDTLQKWEGANYKIKICDCVLELKEALASGTKYDYVINDLTELSVDKDKYGFEYQFETSYTILEFSMKILRTGGKYLARGNSLSATDYRAQFEEDVKTLGYDFTRTDVHVPSFLETYCLYEVVKQEAMDAKTEMKE